MDHKPKKITYRLQVHQTATQARSLDIVMTFVKSQPNDQVGSVVYRTFRLQHQSTHNVVQRPATLLSLQSCNNFRAQSNTLNPQPGNFHNTQPQRANHQGPARRQRHCRRRGVTAFTSSLGLRSGAILENGDGGGFTTFQHFRNSFWY